MYYRAPGRKNLIKVLPNVQPLEETKEKRKAEKTFLPLISFRKQRDWKVFVSLAAFWICLKPQVAFFLSGWEIMCQCTRVVLNWNVTAASQRGDSIIWMCIALTSSRNMERKKMERTWKEQKKYCLVKQTITIPKTVFPACGCARALQPCTPSPPDQVKIPAAAFICPLAEPYMTELQMASRQESN